MVEASHLVLAQCQQRRHNHAYLVPIQRRQLESDGLATACMQHFSAK